MELLRPISGNRYLDCTLGLGGHTARILATGANVTGIDRDPAALELARQHLAPHADRLEVIEATFAEAAELLARSGERFDGVLADLGWSARQLDDPELGMGIRSSGSLDMRMGAGCRESALELVDRLEEQDLADVLRRYGEEPRHRRVARALKRAREAGAESGQDLAEAIRHAVHGHFKRHPALRAFQALRIAVNDELGQLGRLLATLPDLLNPGGTAVVISFHSLEDRMVKESFRTGVETGLYASCARKVVIAGEEEQNLNRRSRPAKLRWAKKAVIG